MSPARAALLGLLADGAVHSGAALGARLGVSRAAVAKHVARLRAIGWPIDARRGAGYLLAADARPLERPAVERALGSDRPRGPDLVLLDEVDSTSVYAAGLAPPPPGRARVCLAEAQTAGRGRRGRAWHARPGGAITFTVDRAVERAPAEFGPLSLAVGVALAEALAEHGIADIGVEWPNDLVRGDAKLGGVLVEVRGQSAGASRALVGVGLNHGQHPDADRPTTSVAEAAAGAVPDRSRLAGALARATVAAIEAFDADGPDALGDRWARRDVLAGRAVRATTARGTIDGVAAGVERDGALRLATADGREERIYSAEVSVRRRP